MVKFGKNKFKALNKIAKKQNLNQSGSNKILKKKLNAEKKVTFQKEVLKEALSGHSALVKQVTAQYLTRELTNKSIKKKLKPSVKSQKDTNATKIKPVEKQKKRQKTQISDTKLLLKLMKKK